MQMTWRLFVAIGLIAALQLTVIEICGTAFTPAPMPEVGPATLPEIIGDFTGRDEPVDERVLTVTRVDAMLNRVYRNHLGDTVVVNLGVWTRYDMGIPHKPDLCYPSAGWEVVSRRLLDVPVGGQESKTIKQFVFQRGTSRIAVAFWAQIGDHTITDSEQIRELRQRARVTGESMGSLVKVMLHTDAKDVGQAEARLSRFVAALVPHIRTVR